MHSKILVLSLLASCAPANQVKLCQPTASWAMPVSRCEAAAPAVVETPESEPEPARDPEPEHKAELRADKIELREKVGFETGEATLLPASETLLDEVAQILADHPEIRRVRIEGHTDDVGSDASNQRLSDARAKSVRAYLISKGIDAGRLESKGFGESKPIADNGTPEGQEQNRRVEIYIVERAP